ncbi:aminoglycoside 6'-N-acetyltransferase [Tateyamaria sp. SN3-11]|uniref:aminoglycoside 6'-N-acetyltransferase n=1 Tax=Tateyamaria sp. SN3-11 TaxID=3092147 RepID=UPI0039ECCF31
MSIRVATAADIDAWVQLRARLWPDTSLEEHRDEAREMLAAPDGACVTFLHDVEGVGPRGFAEVALRRDHVNGCDTSPVAFLEGIYVHPEDRGTGIGTSLLQAVRSWARDRGCSELGSDADLDNRASHAFHQAVGFEETERVVFFRQRL